MCEEIKTCRGCSGGFVPFAGLEEMGRCLRTGYPQNADDKACAYARKEVFENTQNEKQKQTPRGFIEITYSVGALANGVPVGDKKIITALIPVSKMLPIHKSDDGLTIYVGGGGVVESYTPLESYEVILEKLREAQGI